MPDAAAAELLDRLRRDGLSLATAESLTGGLLGTVLTDVPGASAVYRGGVIAYATDVKARVLGVPAEVLDVDGAVSERTALAMATGVRALAGADWALATTGVAGPDRQEGHPPGTVWLAVAGPDGASARRHGFAGDRTTIRRAAVRAALALLAERLDGTPAGVAG